MIQRVQSVYLLISSILILLFLLMPVGYINIDEILLEIKTWGITSTDGSEVVNGINTLGISVVIVSFIALIICLFSTFSYKKRLLQIKLGKLNILIHSAIVFLAFFYVEEIKNSYSGDFSWGSPIIFPLVSMVLLLLANRAIRRDENLVRSADRLRQ